MKKSIIIFTVLGLLTCFYACKKDESNPTQTQTAGTIQGQVTSITGDTVIATALITTLPATSSVRTDTMGNYVIKNVSSGQYTVTASKGYNSSSVNINVLSGKTTIADIHLDYTSAPTLGLVAYYPFNGNANDESGHGNDLTITNAVLTTDRFGNSNKAYSFNGTNAYLSRTSFIGINPGNSVHTICGWIYFSQLPLTGRSWPMLFGNQGTNTSEQWILGTNSVYNVGFYNMSGFGISATPSVWTHICFTYDGSQIKGYLNGQLVQTASASNWNLSGIPLTFAKSVDPSSSAEKYFQGSLDDFRFYNCALSSTEIQSIYNEPNPGGGSSTIGPYENDVNTIALYHFDETSGDTAADGSGNGHTGTSYGATIVAGKFGNARSFNYNTPVVLGNSLFSSPPQQQTIEAWVKVTNWTPGQGNIYYDGNDGEIQLGTSPDSTIHFGANTSTWTFVGSGKLQSNVWYHVAAELDLTTMKERLYINGVLQNEETLASGNITSYGPGGGYRPTIGSYNNGTYFYGLIGLIDEVRISNKIRDVSEFHLSKH
jgi:hypothetical protein